MIYLQRCACAYGMPWGRTRAHQKREEGNEDWIVESRHPFLVVGGDDREYALCIQCGIFQRFLSISWGLMSLAGFVRLRASARARVTENLYCTAFNLWSWLPPQVIKRETGYSFCASSLQLSHPFLFQAGNFHKISLSHMVHRGIMNT
jgi:hypothetical protein